MADWALYEPAQVPIWQSDSWYYVKQGDIEICTGSNHTTLYSPSVPGARFLLDSGSPGFLLHPSIGSVIARELGGAAIPGHGAGDWAYTCDCVSA